MLSILLCHIAIDCDVVVQGDAVHDVVSVLGLCVVVQAVTVSGQCCV